MRKAAAALFIFNILAFIGLIWFAPRPPVSGLMFTAWLTAVFTVPVVGLACFVIAKEAE